MGIDKLQNSIPPHNPFAVSVSLPTWSSNIQYEEGDPAVHNALKSGYPRFVYHPSIKTLFGECETKFSKSGERCLVFPSRRCASECRDFIKRMSPTLLNIDDVTTICKSVRIAEFTLSIQHTAMSPDASDPVTQLVSGPVVLYIVLFNEKLSKVAKQFWQHSGEGISSRFAVFCLKIMKQNRRLIEFATIKSPDAAPKENGRAAGSKYLQFPNNAHDQKHVHDVKRDEASSCEMDVFVEERYGRNLDLRMVEHAKMVLKKRIAGLLGDDTSSNSPTKNSLPAPMYRNVELLTEREVYLFPCGMSAIYNAHRVVTKLRPNKTVQFGFPYLDTLKIQERFGTGCHFFGIGDDAQLDELECNILRKGEKISALFCEFPSNPLLRSPNLRRIRELADQYDFIIVVDETIGNFVNVAVLEWADIVVSSLTKIFSGDCNVMGGSTILNPSSKHFVDISRSYAQLYEDNLWCEDAIFLERNSRTFVKRIRKINGNAEKLATFLHEHPKVEGIYYPLFTDRELYESVMRPGGGYGGLLSIIMKDEKSAQLFYDKLTVAKGPSLGTNFTLASPYTILAHYTELEWANSFGVCKWLVRVSVGLEETEGLVAIFREALSG